MPRARPCRVAPEVPSNHARQWRSGIFVRSAVGLSVAGGIREAAFWSRFPISSANTQELRVPGRGIGYPNKWNRRHRVVRLVLRCVESRLKGADSMAARAVRFSANRRAEGTRDSRIDSTS
jgi:hypothetical protein